MADGVGESVVGLPSFISCCDIVPLSIVLHGQEAIDQEKVQVLGEYSLVKTRLHLQLGSLQPPILALEDLLDNPGDNVKARQ